ncbi:hypothetical protein HU200_063487 [Digitaria exilis]|uniref:Uncharacterized protein n=1 Tax=Digitaria exilis TaxID=1010633 RepID=A0A835A7P8_9POAL|nr:hypothetical protein HU200_063487 [Digitaria exilis]
MTAFDYPGQSWGSGMFFEKSVMADVLESCNGCFTIRCDMCIVRLKIENNPIQIPESVLHQDLSRMLNDKEGTDVTFSVDDRFFHAHRYILAARSMVFKAQLFGAMKEAEDAHCIKVEDMEPQAFEGLLHYIYTDALPDDHHTADRITATQHLLVAADRYGLDRLRAMCEARLSGWIDVQSVATILALAEQHQCVELRNHCLRFLGWPGILRAVMKTDGFKHLVASYPSVVTDVLETVVSARIARVFINGALAAAAANPPRFEGRFAAHRCGRGRPDGYLTAAFRSASLMDARSVTGPPQAIAVTPPPSSLVAGSDDHPGGGGGGCALPDGCLLPKTSSTSLTKSVTAVHDFRVTDYSLLDGMGVGRFVASSAFSAGGRDWTVRFYPDGATVGCLGHVSAFLYYSNRDALPGVRVRFTLNLLDRDGRTPQMTNPYMKHTFSPASDNWGFIKFIEKSKLSPYLHKDCLTIRCVLTVVVESRTVKDEMNSAVVVPPPNLHQDFEKMLKDGEGADVTFIVDGQLFHAHRCVLAYRSPVFSAELFGPMKENATSCIRIDDMEPMIFEALLHYIYTDRLPVSCSDGRNAAMQHLLVAADRYGVERLRLMCESKLSEAIDMETVATTLALAEQHNCPQLRRACIGFMASPNMLGPVMETDGFNHLVASCPLILKEILDKVTCIWSDNQQR